MNKYSYLLKNIGLMTLSNFASKILSFLLVPLYTSVLTTADYGLYDIYTTTAFLLVPLLSGAISQAVLRFSLDKNSDQASVFSESLKVFVKASLTVVIAVLLNYKLNLVSLFNHYPVYFVLYYGLCLLSDILSAFARGIEAIFDVAISGLLSSVAIIVLNIALLIVFPMGVSGYFIANISAFAIAIIYLTIRLKLWRFLVSAKDSNLRGQMHEYSKPLIFDQIAWWINNVSDRYIVTWICGAAANGVYSVAFKIPSILNVFQTIFNQAWTLSAVKEIDEGSGKFYSEIYSTYNCGLVILCSLLLMGDKIIARILYANDFYSAWQYAPFLSISVIFSCLCGVFEGIFAAAKETKVLATSTVLGAAINIGLNFFLVKTLGPIGAAFSTLVSYCLVWFIRLKKAAGIVSLSINLGRDAVSYLILISQSLALLAELDSCVLFGVELGGLLAILFLYLNEIKGLLSTLLLRLQR